MIVNLDDAHIRRAVGGIEDRGRGIVRAAFSKIANAPDAGPHYDHKRHQAERQGAASWQIESNPQSDHDIWDFVFDRNDGTSFWLHPNWGNGKVEYGECDGSAHRVRPPASGRGGSGDGMYKGYKNARKDADFKFDKTKNRLRGATRAKPFLAGGIA